jgi:two-component SAPR family response regulator
VSSATEEQPRILILEDDQALRDTLAKMLGKRGYQVDTAGSGSDAVERAAHSPYDLIITDIRMEGMDGLEALEKVKQSQPDIASLVITGYSTEEDSIRAIRLGVGEYLKKPFRLPTLFESVGQLMAKRKKNQSSGSLPATLFVVLERLLTRSQGFSRTRSDYHDQLQQAEKVARRVGLDEQQAQWVRLATICKKLEESGWEWDAGLLPARLLSVLEAVDQHWPDIPLESRIVAAVLKIHADTQHYDPEILSALHQTHEAPVHSTRQQAGLLAVAEALARKGQFQAAKSALQNILDSGKTNRRVVESLLKLSTLCQREGNNEDGIEYAQRAIKEATRLGPRFEGQLHQRAAALWRSSNPSVAEPWFTRALSLAERVHDPVLAALVNLSTTDESDKRWSALNLLLQPANAPELAEALPWLLPQLLGSDDPQVEPVLDSWVVDYAPLLEQLLQSRKLDEVQCIRALQAIGRSGTPESASLVELFLTRAEAKVKSIAEEVLLQVRARGAGTISLRICSFGKFQVFRGLEESVGWKTQKVRYLLAYLVGLDGGTVSDDRLIEQFWPDADQPKGRKSLNTALSFLRAHLKKSLQVEELIERDPSGIRLNPKSPLWSDLSEFRRLAALAAKSYKNKEPDLESNLRRMADLYRGPYLDGCYMDWALEQRGQLERFAREATLRLTQQYAATKQWEEAAEAALRALDIDPCQEQAAILLVRSYKTLGRREEAIRFARDFRQTLEEELGIAPDEEFEEELKLE